MKAITQAMVQHLIALAETAKVTSDKRPIQAYLESLSSDQQAEFLALMWYGRNDAIDGPIPFNEHVQYAKEKNMDHAGAYMAGKVLVLADYLRDALRLLGERNEE